MPIEVSNARAVPHGPDRSRGALHVSPPARARGGLLPPARTTPPHRPARQLRAVFRRVDSGLYRRPVGRFAAGVRLCLRAGPGGRPPLGLRSGFVPVLELTLPILLAIG